MSRAPNRLPAGGGDGDDAPVSPRALVADNVALGTGSSIEPFATVGWNGDEPVSIGARTRIGAYALVEPGVVIGDDCTIDAYCRVAAGTRIGDRTQVLYGAAVFENAIIGEACIVGGNVADRTLIEDCVTFFGEIAHTYRHPGDLEAWDNTIARSPTIRRCSVVGQNAIIVGDVEIGPGSYVGAGEVVRVRVPEGMLYQHGKLVELSKLRGLVTVRTDGVCA